ncbi:MAG: tRNA (N(6)-L-threonylcarbamoyladenosine(37)-C(2))-methylthiotransferase MtaB [Prolixibacteraceae bacterium]|jgi:threonylcarbamoyladenosine tRNA methylthiotransferase MtaB|nr:tRNA (N(6)-L-threonylcarbamoyladenosine(37)-C(2))-methylthiotransferase MtaB [Prolixibacteraceae bacterium]
MESDVNTSTLSSSLEESGGGFMKGRRVAFKTLGCRLNQYETDALVSEFDKAGYQLVDFKDKADVVVVNTCTVTNQSDHKSRNTISQAASKNKGAVVIVTGCMAENYKQQLEGEEKITYVVDNKRKSSILPLVEAHFSGEIVHPGKVNADVFNFQPVKKSLHTRSAVKIQDGCDNFCTFCIIPSVRGRAVSRPVGQILDNVKRTVENGFKEIVVTGVNIGRYDSEGLRFENVLEKILEVPGDFRVRISSLEPDGFGNEFVHLFDHPKLMPHLHLCLQSGSDQVLLRMRRMYSRKQFASTVETFRNKYSDFNFTTDIIVGFPGETDEDFQETLNAIREFQFSHVHTFKYSVRRGTRAERMDGQIPEKLKNERSVMVRTLSEEFREKYFGRFIGKEQTILIESVDNKGLAKGYGEHYIPVRVKVPGLEPNTFSRVTIRRMEGKGEKSHLAG